MKCQKCNSESVSKINPWIDYGAAAAGGAAFGTVVPFLGTLIGAILATGVTMANSRHHTLQVYHKCRDCGFKF